MSYFKPDGQLSQDAAIRTMEKCLADIQSWMIDERLLINDDKTEVLYCDSSQYQEIKVCKEITHTK